MSSSWRNHSTHREETKAVKEALAKAGIPVRSVGHGKGTAWAWMEVYLGQNPSGQDHDHPRGGQPGCPSCVRNREIVEEVHRIVGETTGRTGDYNGEVMVLSQ